MNPEVETIVIDRTVYVLVENKAAGRKNRFTVYKLPPDDNHGPKVIGRELPPGVSRRIIRRDAQKDAYVDIDALLAPAISSIAKGN